MTIAQQQPTVAMGRPKLVGLWIANMLPWLAALLTYFVAGGYLSLGTNALIMALFTLSLDLALGYAGIVTLGHAAFFGFGAYAAGIFSIHVVGDPMAGLLVATVLAGILGILAGMLILHTRGLTMMMLTLATAAVIAQLANQNAWLTGGDDGLTGISMLPLFGLFKFDLWGKTAYLYSLGVLLMWSLMAWRIMRSPFGRSLDGIRQNTARMRSIGTPVWWRLVAAYGISAAIAGTAGALMAQTTETVSLSSFDLLTSGTVLVMLVLGGMRSRYGALLGAVVYVVAQNFAAEVDPFRWMFAIGILLIGSVLFFDNGLSGAPKTLATLWYRLGDRKRRQ